MSDMEKVKDLLRQTAVLSSDIADCEGRLAKINSDKLKIEMDLVERLDKGNDADNTG